jgi:hypothetical protein
LRSATRSRQRRSRSSARERTIMRVNEIGRRQWKKESGYPHQARVENTMTDLGMPESIAIGTLEKLQSGGAVARFRFMQQRRDMTQYDKPFGMTCKLSRSGGDENAGEESGQGRLCNRRPAVERAPLPPSQNSRRAANIRPDSSPWSWHAMWPRSHRERPSDTSASGECHKGSAQLGQSPVFRRPQAARQVGPL